MSLLQECRRLLLVLLPAAIYHQCRDAANNTVYGYMPLDSNPPGASPSSYHVGDTSPRRQPHATWSWAWVWRRCRRRCCLVVAVALAIVVILALALGLGLGLGFDDDEDDGSGPVIDLGYANYTGSYLSNGISQYLGMRYARPPTGDLRWRAPVEPENEGELQRARSFGPTCYGISQSPDDSHDEDCLFVNVWGPANATADMKLPVMVFIQGGGYTSLSNADWNGTQLVETSDNNVVFVTFNYRVGLWGFLAGHEVREDGDLNVGLLDQRFLFRWVQENISKFGGDPDHVVIQGVSAGGGSVALHLAAYGGRDDGLFVGTISESTFVPAHPSVSDLEFQFDRLAYQAGCSTAENRMGCLRGKSTKKLQKLNVEKPFPGRRYNALFYWTPCVDGEFLEDIPSVLFQEGRFLSVPSLIGTCTNEGTIFAPTSAKSPSSLTTFLADQYPNLTTAQTDTILDYYPLEPAIPDHGPWFPSAARAYGDATFICPANNILDALATSTVVPSNSTPPLYSYRYNVYDEASFDRGMGVSHVFEAPAVFGPDMMSQPAPESYYSYNADIIPIVMKYWLSFARTFDTNVYRADGAPEWETWGQNRQRMLLQTNNSTMERVSRSEVDRCEFWKGIGTTTNQK